MLRTLGQQILGRLRRTAPARGAHAAADAATQRNLILRGVYDRNRDDHAPGARKRGPRAPAAPVRAASRRRALYLALPLAVAGLLAALQILHASGRSGDAALSLLGPATQPASPPPSVPARTAGGPLRAAPAPAPSATAPGGGALPAADLAGIAPLLSEKENLKNLFGLSVKNIVIDAGHGGHDPGAIGKTGAFEKDITLDVARRLKAKLEKNAAYRVLLVRDDDVFVPLYERAAFANANDTDLFVSIHVNYLPGTSTNAVETYYFGRHQDPRTRKLAERENRGSEYSLSEFEGILRNVQDSIKLQESKALADAIQGSMLARIRADRQRVLDNGVRQAPFVVLLGVKAPSVLVEIGSLSSPDAEGRLAKESYRDEIASHVVAGISRYLDGQPPEERRTHGKDEGRLAKRQ